MQTPLVSIVIPSYKPDCFEQTLRSALGQTYLHTEIVVSDNCPTDAIEKICATFPMVQYRRNPVVGGRNVLTTLYAGTGTYIKPLFDDDLLHPFCIERLVGMLEAQPSAGLAFSASATIDNANRRTGTRQLGIDTALLSGRDLQRRMVLNFVNVIGEFSTIVYRRQDIMRIEPDQLFHYHGKDYVAGLADVAAFLNLCAHRNLCYSSEELSYFRHDTNHQSNSNPAANPNFVNCVTDWVDLLLASYQLGVISARELADSQTTVEPFLDRWASAFPSVDTFRTRFRSVIAAAQL